MSKIDWAARYMAAGHAVQCALKFWLAKWDAGKRDNEENARFAPWAQRLNSDLARTDQAGLAQLLIDKKLITYAEYLEAITKAAEREKELHEAIAEDSTGSDTKITFV